MGQRKELRTPVVKMLWGEAGGQCSNCQTKLVKEAGGNKYPVGIHAHIRGLKEGAARYDANYPTEKLDEYENIILLCPTCHDEIDKNRQAYTLEVVLAMKAKHIHLINEKLGNTLPTVTFEELTVTTRYLKSAPIGSEDLTVIPPAEKIAKNQLSSTVANLITHGLTRRKVVHDFLNSRTDVDFANELRAGFVNQYQSLKDQGYNGDELFYALLDFASGGSNEFTIKAAGLALVSYYFEICEVFEK